MACWRLSYDQAYDESDWLELLPVRLRERVWQQMLVHKQSTGVFLSECAPEDPQWQWGCY